MAAGAVGLSLAFTAPVSAASFGDNFSVDQSCGASGDCSEVGGTLTNVDRVNFGYSAVIDQSNDGSGPGGALDGDSFVEKGFATWTGYLNDANNNVPGSSLNFDYQVYMIFTATGTASFDGTEITALFDTFTVEVYVSDETDTNLVLPATTAGDVTNTGSSADDQLIATANLLSAGEAHLFGGLANGDFEIIVSDFGLELFGESFLTDPSPFYEIMNFAGVTTIVSGATPFAPFTATAQGSGDLYFTVPEPGTLGLLGGGLLGAAALLRRRKAAKAA
jgi:hypothetical protein